MLFPIKDEEHKEVFIDKEMYKNVFRKCNQNLKEMKINPKKGYRMISKKKLIEVVKDIEAIRTGNYILVDN